MSTSSVVNGVRIAYQDTGKGEPLVLVRRNSRGPNGCRCLALRVGQKARSLRHRVRSRSNWSCRQPGPSSFLAPIHGRWAAGERRPVAEVEHCQMRFSAGAFWSLRV